jgi:hypothetical protein
MVSNVVTTTSDVKYLMGVKVKVKVSLYRRLMLPVFLDNRNVKVAISSALGTGRLYPRRYTWYSFLLQADSTPGPQCGRKY